MQYHEFMGKVQSRAHLGSTGEAVTAARATLEVLAQRLAGGTPENLAAQLPSEVGTYLTGQETDRAFDLDEFYEKVSQRENVELPDAVHHARAVMSVLQEAVSQGLLEDIRAQLPEEYNPLFEYDGKGEAAE